MDTSEQGKLLPFYVVIDVSYSMSGVKLDTANQIMPAVLDAVAKAPILADKVRFSVIDFSDDARVRLPLCDILDDGVQLPSLTLRGGTSFVSAFRLLRTEIESNVKQLKADGFLVHRPAVFFISDGVPTDQDSAWQSAFADLTTFDKVSRTGFSMYPNFVPFGVDDADPRTLQQLIHPTGGGKPMRMFLQSKDSDAAAAIAGMAEVLISSVLASGESMTRGDSGIILPSGDDLPPGLSSYTADDDFV
ncbi:vWA domain-containing protein [Actinokineospora inagensis]|uniref:vWA domain-containing protein n=1 Tax=Actinokineospora inagensis TaxID=103730 RepID=UPI000409EE34|nr:VWA domain-containing protein [Actinokineospora inagensis]